MLTIQSKVDQLNNKLEQESKQKESHFNIGDVVELNSQKGPLMVIEKWCIDDDTSFPIKAVCLWFVDGKPVRESFAPHCLSYP